MEVKKSQIKRYRAQIDEQLDAIIEKEIIFDEENAELQIIDNAQRAKEVKALIQQLVRIAESDGTLPTVGKN